MAAASPAKAEQTIKATAAEKQAAERLGSVFQYLAGLKGLPLDVWAIPAQERIGSAHGAFQGALRAIYGTDTERERALGRKGYLSAFAFYKKDYEAVIPKVGQAALRRSRSALTREELALG